MVECCDVVVSALGRGDARCRESWRPSSTTTRRCRLGSPPPQPALARWASLVAGHLVVPVPLPARRLVRAVRVAAGRTLFAMGRSAGGT
jgi:hypothetical protein